MLRKSWVLSFLFTASILNASLITAPRKIDNISEQRIGWKKDGQNLRVLVSEIDGKDFISINQLATIAEAGVDWQQVSKRVCLSRAGKSICFDWEKDGVIHSRKNVYLPVRYLLSEDFQRFSATSIVWDEKGNQFLQKSPVTVSVSPVENAGKNYVLKLDVAEDVKYELLQRDSRRIWFRFIGGRAGDSAILEGDNIIQRVRLIQRRRSADVIMELGGAALSNEVYFDENERKLVVEVKHAGPAVAASIQNEPDPVPVVPVPVAAPVGKVDLAVKKAKVRPLAEPSLRTIVIDAGHGGHDAGAIGVRGTYEKDINLKVAKLLAERLEKEKNIRVILTRSTDQFVALAQRTQIANDARADLFISIHCNSSLSSKHSGFELYVLSPEATDDAAEAVARLENSVIALESKKSAKSDKVSTLLASMAVNNYINESLECATLLGRAAKAQASVQNSVVKEANFYVLRGAQMPSVLVELEYVSNPIAELKLRSARYRAQIAKALASGVMDVDKRFRKKQESMAARNSAATGAPRNEQ